MMQPNPPAWPASVAVFDMTSNPQDIASAVNKAFAINGGEKNNGQFSPERFAFLFSPGTYTVDVPIGFYTQVLGLGDSPDDVVFAGDMGVYAEEGDSDYHVGGLNNFWRSAENFRTKSAYDWIFGNGMMWANSQASPLRRVHVDHDLLLYEYEAGASAGYVSGGFIADSKVEGKVDFGSQQQYFTRNIEMDGDFTGGAWNMVFSGDVGAPFDHCGDKGLQPITTQDATPLMAEKPFITRDHAGQFSLNIPEVQSNTVGPSWTGTGNPRVEKVDFSRVYVTRPTDTAAMINAQLDMGFHVVVTPAIYQLTEPIVISKPNTVLLCLGLATLKSVGGNETIVVEDVDGVRVGGCLLEAGSRGAPALLRWGTGYKGNLTNPGFLYDIPARVGGPDPASTSVSCDAMVVINNGYVVGDNLWLWRADHSKSGPVMNGDNPVANGLVVRGDNVHMYGLAVEHVLEDGVSWEGENGMTIFFQCELPYDVDQNYGDKGYVGYRVAEGVTEHVAAGAGVYSFFRDYEVTVETAISCPPAVEAGFKFPMTKFLKGKGSIATIINGKGAAIDKNHGGPVYKC